MRAGQLRNVPSFAVPRRNLSVRSKKKKNRTANPREKKNKESLPDGTLPGSHHGPYSSPNLNACHSIQLTAGVGQSDLRL